MKKTRDISGEKLLAESPILLWETAHREKRDRKLLEAFEEVKHLTAIQAYREGLRDGMKLAGSLSADRREERAG